MHTVHLGIHFRSIVVTSYMCVCSYQTGQIDAIGKTQLQVQVFSSKMFLSL